MQRSIALAKRDSGVSPASNSFHKPSRNRASKPLGARSVMRSTALSFGGLLRFFRPARIQTCLLHRSRQCHERAAWLPFGSRRWGALGSVRGTGGQSTPLAMLGGILVTSFADGHGPFATTPFSLSISSTNRIMSARSANFCSRAMFNSQPPDWGGTAPFHYPVTTIMFAE